MIAKRQWDKVSQMCDCFEGVLELIEQMDPSNSERGRYECEAYFNLIALRLIESYLIKESPLDLKTKYLDPLVAII